MKHRGQSPLQIQKPLRTAQKASPALEKKKQPAGFGRLLNDKLQVAMDSWNVHGKVEKVIGCIGRQGVGKSWVLSKMDMDREKVFPVQSLDCILSGKHETVGVQVAMMMDRVLLVDTMAIFGSSIYCEKKKGHSVRMDEMEFAVYLYALCDVVVVVQDDIVDVELWEFLKHVEILFEHCQLEKQSFASSVFVANKMDDMEWIKPPYEEWKRLQEYFEGTKFCVQDSYEYGDLDQPMKGKVPFFRIPYANRKVYRMESPQEVLMKLRLYLLAVPVHPSKSMELLPYAVWKRTAAKLHDAVRGNSLLLPKCFMEQRFDVELRLPRSIDSDTEFQACYASAKNSLRSPTWSDIQGAVDAYQPASPRRYVPFTPQQKQLLESPRNGTKVAATLKNDMQHNAKLAQQEARIARKDFEGLKERCYQLEADKRVLKEKEVEMDRIADMNRQLLIQLEKAEQHIEILREEKHKISFENSHLSSQLKRALENISTFEIREKDDDKRLQTVTKKCIDNETEASRYKQRLLKIESDLEAVMASKDANLVSLKTKLANMSHDYFKLQSFNEEVRMQNTECEKLLNEKTKRMEALDRQLQQTNEALLEERNVKINARQVQMELEHIRIDNRRMIKLIAATKEFEAFKYFNEADGTTSRIPTREDMEEGHCQLLLTGDKQDLMDWGKAVMWSAKQYDLNMDTKEQIEFSEEEKNWIPRDAMLLSHKFKDKHLLSLPMNIIHEFLRQLNLIWQRRERWRSDKIKDVVQERVSDLERKAKNRVPYQTIVQEVEIQRLKKEILKLYRQRQSRAVSAAAKKSQEEQQFIAPFQADDTKFLAESIATTESLSRQLELYCKRNKELEITIKGYQKALGFNDPNGVATGLLNKQGPSEELSAAMDAKRSRWFKDGVIWLGDRLSNMSQQFINEWMNLLNETRRKSYLVSNLPDERATDLMKLLQQSDSYLRQQLHEYRIKVSTSLSDAVKCVQYENSLK